jgi:F1F0 ATPase subunit 2
MRTAGGEPREELRGTAVVEVSRWVLVAAGGAALGVLYFGGLWLTVRRLPASEHPATLLLGSFVVRAALAVGGFFLLLSDEPLRLAVALGAFLVVRLLLVHRARAGLVPGGGGAR